MSTNDNVGRISLSMLRGRSANQSVPSISFRFNSGSDDLIKIEDNEDLLSSSIPESSTPDAEKNLSDSRESSPKRERSSLGHRSSSLDDTTTLSPEASKSLPEGSGLISRLTKTFEHKINVIRNEKKERDLKSQIRDSEDLAYVDENIVSPNTESSSSASRAFEGMKKFSLDSKENSDTSSSPSKVKTTLIQDFNEQTNKLKSDFNRNIRPKISELRNRKSLKNNTGSPKIKNSLLQFLGKEDSIVSEVSLNECHPVDSAVEALEDGLDILDTEKEGIEKSITNENLDRLARVDSTSEHRSSTQSENTLNINEKEFNNNSKYLFLLREMLSLSKSVNSKYLLALFFVCFFGPLPGFLSGFILGVSVVLYLGYLILPLVLPEQQIVPKQNDSVLASTFLKSEECFLHMGWMNELDGTYFPESYHVSQTHTVFLRLQGSLLQIDNSRKKINKHARPNEEPQCGTFVHHREYDLSGCEIILLPKNLPRRWLWSRKYPIFIRFQRKPKTPFLSPQESPESSPTKSSSKDTHSRSQTPEEGDASSESFEGNRKWENDVQPKIEESEEKAMSSSVDLDSYEEVTQDMCEEASLCLFARTDREKDDWYRRFTAASKKKPNERKEANGLSALFASTPEAEVSLPFESSHQESDQRDIISEEFKEGRSHIQQQQQQQTSSPLSYEQYMSRLMDKNTEIEEGVSWLNSFVGRILYDFIHDRFWANKIQERVQRKLSKLHIPYFVDEIIVSGVELGDSVPQLLSAGRPTLDHRGIWVDLNVSYIGSFRMTLETKLDLMKLKANSPVSGASSNPPSPVEPSSSAYVGGKTRSYARSPSSDCILRNVQFDTDTDDSVESSSEEEPPEDDMGERTPGGGRKFLRIVDTVTASKYFQHVSEWRLLQRAMKGVSNTRIELTVEVRKIKGTLALNIPHIPADRVWYGFRGSPEFVMVAKPCLGERQLDTLPFLSDFIQKQLRTVFEKVFVLPNMDDLVIPIMSATLPGQHLPLRPPWDHHLELPTGESSSPSPKTSLTKNNISLDLLSLSVS
ncbi:Testis-expressed sequence 2 protein [Armadillidium vulgare]|nr:Testis-expressed sequence 2 protein [Armadillidium vulgare]